MKQQADESHQVTQSNQVRAQVAGKLPQGGLPVAWAGRCPGSCAAPHHGFADARGAETPHAGIFRSYPVRGLNARPSITCADAATSFNIRCWAVDFTINATERDSIELKSTADFQRLGKSSTDYFP